MANFESEERDFSDSLYDDLDVASADSLSTDDLDMEAYSYGYGVTQGSTGDEAIRQAKEFQRYKDARERSGLTGDRIFEYGQKLKDISEGKRKTEGQIEAEKELAILAKAQRGQAMGYGGFDAAEVMQRAGRSAQEIEIGGETAISKAARQAELAAADQLEQLLISSQQRAEDRAFAMQQLEFQQGQASGSLWSNVLGGVLGAIGAVVGGFAGGPAGAIVGGKAGTALGSGTGRYLG